MIFTKTRPVRRAPRAAACAHWLSGRARTRHSRDRTERLVDLDVPLAALLPLLKLLLPVDALRLADALEHVRDARHHALEAAEVHVRAVIHPVEDLRRVLLHLVLDVHLAALLVRLLARERVVEAEVVRVRLPH